MTATVENAPFELLQHITARITAEVKEVNRVLFDLTPKPAGTIEEDKGGRTMEIAQNLSDNKEWKSHGRSISRVELGRLKLQIDN